MKHPPNKLIYRQIARLIKKNKTFFIAGHRRPDGDSIAAQLVIASILKKLGKSCDIFSADPVPRNLLFLPGVSRIRVKRRVGKKYDVAFIVECSGPDRMGNIIDLHTQAKYVVNIDHHTHFADFGDVNLVNPDASSSCEQVHGLFTFLNMKMDYNTALCLYVGIVTDTGLFRHANTRPLTHELAAIYLSCGVDPTSVFQHIYQQKSLGEMHALGGLLSHIRLFLSEKVAVIEITPGQVDTEDVVNFGMMISSVKVTVLFQQASSSSTRVSLRSRGPIDIGWLAKSLGGGGHFHAAGCTINKNLHTARLHILKKLKKLV